VSEKNQHEETVMPRQMKQSKTSPKPKGLPAHKNPAVQWKPGQSGNPLGRPLGARSKFSEAALNDLLDDWLKHGASVLARVRDEDPSTYIRVAFNAIPKDVQIAIEQRSGPLDTNEMRMLRRLVDMIDAAGAANIADSETVLGWIEEDLRGRLAKPIA
jgi:hypothetical protein